MATDNVNIHGRAGRALPTKVTEGKDVDTRHSLYGEIVPDPLRRRQRMAAEGTYFIAHNATNDASTTIAGHAAPVLADADATMTKPLIHCVHSGGVSSTVLVYLDYIVIEVVTAGATATQACWATQIDTGASRITTAGTALTTHSPNMQSTATPLLAPTAGAIVVGAESANVRRLSHGTHRPSIEVAGDKYIHVFGGDPESFASSDTAATAIRTFVVNQPPVILGPTDFFLFALHGQASQNAAGVYKIRMGWVER
jgi:hypothetical protein